MNENDTFIILDSTLLCSLIEQSKFGIQFNFVFIQSLSSFVSFVIIQSSFSFVSVLVFQRLDFCLALHQWHRALFKIATSIYCA